jgi:hypothetical protein
MTSPRVVAYGATGVTLAEDPDGVAREVLAVLLSDFGERWQAQLRAGTSSELQLGPSLRAERVRAAVRDRGAQLTLACDEVDRLVREAWEFRHAFRLEHFPLGATLDHGRYELRELIHGGPDRGLYRAHDHEDDRSMLVTLGPPQREAAEVVSRRLALALPGIARLRHIGPLAVDGELRYDGMVEEEPTGQASIQLALPLTLERTLQLGLGVAERITAAHARSTCLGGLRPELVYVSGDEVTGVAPRCESFLATARPREYGVAQAFSHFYFSPERLARPDDPATPEGDVFALAAMMAYWNVGEHPFLRDYAANAISIMTQQRRWGMDPWLAGPIDEAMRPVPQRMSLEYFVALLTNLLAELRAGTLIPDASGDDGT